MSNIKSAVLKVARANPEFARLLKAELSRALPTAAVLLPEFLAAIPKTKIVFTWVETRQTEEKKRVVSKDITKVGYTYLFNARAHVEFPDKYISSVPETKEEWGPFGEVARELARKGKRQLETRVKQSFAGYDSSSLQVAGGVRGIPTVGPEGNMVWLDNDQVARKATKVRFAPTRDLMYYSRQQKAFLFYYEIDAQIAVVLKAKMGLDVGVFDQMSSKEIAQFIREDGTYWEDLSERSFEMGLSQSQAQRYLSKELNRRIPLITKALRDLPPVKQQAIQEGRYHLSRW